MNTPLTSRRGVETAVAALQARLADGDPSDDALRQSCETDLEALRAAYRAQPSFFSKETVEALRELRDLLQAPRE